MFVDPEIGPFSLDDVGVVVVFRSFVRGKHILPVLILKTFFGGEKVIEYSRVLVPYVEHTTHKTEAAHNHIEQSMRYCVTKEETVPDS